MSAGFRPEPGTFVPRRMQLIENCMITSESVTELVRDYFQASKALVNHLFYPG
jgi:hypothetical protein